MRIVHLSDIHFSAQNLNSFEEYYIDAICNDLQLLNEAKKIDAVCLTGDLVDKGGISFGSAQAGYESFINKFWKPISQRVGISNDILFMIPGNHDINEKKINIHYEAGLLSNLKTLQDVDNYVSNYNPDTDYGLKRQEDYKNFEKSFYKYNANSEITDFESYHILNLPLGKVGFACINTSWRCSTKLPDNNLVFGTVQIRRAARYLKDKGCDFMIGLMHHPLDFISKVEQDESLNFLQKLGYNAILFGHTHHGKTNLSIGNDGNLFISTARTGFSNPAQEIDKYKSGYTILDFKFDELIVDCHYRKYIHSRIEFDKDVDLARDGSCSFPIKSISKQHKDIFNTPVDNGKIIITQAAHTEINDSGGLVIEQTLKTFIQESDKLNYTSSKEDFEFVKHLEQELHKQIFFPLNDKIKNIPSLQGVFIQSLFEKVYSSEIFDDTIISDIQRVRDNKELYKWYERKVLISSITLSLLSSKKFSQKKAELLIDFLTDFEENVWEGALVGLVISLIHNHNKWDRFDSLKSRLATLRDLGRVQDGLHTIERIFRLELYKNSFFQPDMYNLSFFDNPLNCFLPFYSDNPALNDALDSNGDDTFDIESFEDDVKNLPFPDSYKYVLCLGVQKGLVTQVKLAGEKYHSYMDKIKYSAIFYPYQNLLLEYYNYFNSYPKSNIKDVFKNSLSINQTKLKNIILDKVNALEITAESHMHSDNYNSAIQILAKIIEAEPTHFAANWKTAVSLLSLKRPDAFKALKYLKVLNNSYPEDIRVLVKIADCYHILKNRPKQLDYLEKARTINPRDRETLTDLGNFYRQEKKLDESLSIYLTAFELYPLDYYTLMGLCLTYKDMKNTIIAIGYGIQAEEYAPKERKEYVYFNLCDLALHNRDYENAIKYGHLTLESNSSDAANLMNTGRAYLFGPKRDIEKAKMYFDKSIKKKETYYCFGNLGHWSLLSGNTNEAIKYYNKSIKLFDTIESFRESMNIDEHLMIDSGIDLATYQSIRDKVITEFECA